MYAVTAAEFTAEGTANIPNNRYIPLWPRSILSDNGLQFSSKLSQTVYKLLGIPKIATSSYHPNGSGGMDRLNHTMAQMLEIVVNEIQNNWDERLPHAEFAYNDSVSAATGLAPNEVHMGFRAFLSRFSNVPGSPITRAWPAITSPTATWRPTASSPRTISSVNTMPSQFLAWNDATQPSPTHCARTSNSPLVAGCGCTTRLSPSAWARRRTRTPRSSRPSARSTGRTSTKSSELAPASPLILRTASPGR